jgi:hypothetical protein
MGTNIPDPRQAQIVWFETHLPRWIDDPEKFGLDAQQVGELKDIVHQTRTAWDTARAARQAAKDATVNQQQMLKLLGQRGREAVNVIKATIELRGDASLWGHAGLQPPDPRGTSGTPNAPFELAAHIDSIGNITLTWKARHPKGVASCVYLVYRSIGSGPDEFVGTAEGKRFEDRSVPTGVKMISYTITAQRGRKRSEPSPRYVLSFGSREPGTAKTAASALNPATKLAA